MDVTVKIKRYDPDAERPQAAWQEYPISIDENATVLDALIMIREEVDGTLSLRCSCRSSICGSCAMRINGHAGLACKTKASESMDADGTIVVEPAGVMPTMKDLVVNFDLFWKKIEEVEPYLKPEVPEPEAEYIASNESMLHLSGVTACIMCGACVSDCTVLEVDPTFLGPAALAKAYRFTADPRDGDANGVSRDPVGVTVKIKRYDPDAARPQVEWQEYPISIDENNTDLIFALELGFMLDCAETIAVSALERKESRGAQFRLDYPSRDDENWLKHIVVSQGEVGPELSNLPVTITKWTPEERKY